jgi:hypothetical protein
VNFTDATVVALADPQTRSALFDQTALEQLLGAAYDADAMGPFDGPYTAGFDELELGYAPGGVDTMEGTWATAGATEHTEARFTLARADDGAAPRVDAVWRGAIAARYRPVGEPVTEFAAEWSAGVPDPDAATAHATVTLAPPAPATAQAQRLPIVVALLVRDGPLAISALLAETKAARRRLAPAGLEQSGDPALRLRHAVVMAWVVPSTVFDDPDWPGADAAARRLAAGNWLAREGIGLVAVP